MARKCSSIPGSMQMCNPPQAVQWREDGEGIERGRSSFLPQMKRTRRNARALLVRPFCIATGGVEATADPSTSLRFAQDDNSVVMQFFGTGSNKGACLR